MPPYELARTAPAFLEMAHRFVCATVASVDRLGRPRSRILHSGPGMASALRLDWHAAYPVEAPIRSVERSAGAGRLRPGCRARLADTNLAGVHRRASSAVAPCVFPGRVLPGQGGEVLVWQSDDHSWGQRTWTTVLPLPRARIGHRRVSVEDCATPMSGMCRRLRRLMRMGNTTCPDEGD